MSLEKAHEAYHIQYYTRFKQAEHLGVEMSARVQRETWEKHPADWARVTERQFAVDEEDEHDEAA